MRKCGNPKRKNAYANPRNDLFCLTEFWVTNLLDEAHTALGYTQDLEAERIQTEIYSRMSMV